MVSVVPSALSSTMVDAIRSSKGCTPPATL
jgi:hypothetical protein